MYRRPLEGQQLVFQFYALSEYVFVLFCTLSEYVFVLFCRQQSEEQVFPAALWAHQQSQSGES